ncbi:MAG TPA: LytTR family DNA-binding domain-containing protein [Bryobacteraceae bacterium]|jgi:two-component system LytT family response regulator
MKAFLVDDEKLAVERLQRLLEATGRVEIAGASTDPSEALREIRQARPDLLFLDIEMPGMSGFELLEKLGPDQPLVVFTTAYHKYALEAFRVNSIDYLLKPVNSEQLERTLNKLERIRQGSEPPRDLHALLGQVREALERREPDYLVRVASRTGDRVDFVDVSRVTHFYAKDKLTFAATAAKEYALDLTITELEQRLHPSHWIRIHRSVILNIDQVKELHSWFDGKLLVRLKDGKTELHVPRERAAAVRAKLGI